MEVLSQPNLCPTNYSPKSQKRMRPGLGTLGNRNRHPTSATCFVRRNSIYAFLPAPALPRLPVSRARLGLTILFSPGGISFTFINEAGGQARLFSMHSRQRARGGGLMKLFPQDHMVARLGFVPRF